MVRELKDIFPHASIHSISEDWLRRNMEQVLEASNLPIISLDRVYYPRGGFSLETTRLVDASLQSIGGGSRNQVTVQAQLERIAALFRGKAVQVAEDVIYAGDSIIGWMQELEKCRVTVSRVVAAIVIEGGIQKIQVALDGHVFTIHSMVSYGEVIDEICERDFYAGVPFSGRLIGERQNGIAIPIQFEAGAPYFYPFGLSEEWASIPKDREMDWAKFCLKESLHLWKKIEELSGRRVYFADLDRRPYRASLIDGGTRFVSFLEEIIKQL